MSHWASYVIASTILLLTICRVISLGQAVTWTVRRGGEFKAMVSESPPSQWYRRGVETVFEDLGAAHVGLFGVANYRLHPSRHQHRRTLVRLALNLVRFLWRFQVFSLALCATLGALAYSTWGDPAAVPALYLATTITLLVGCLLQAAQFFTSFVIIGSYRAPFHDWQGAWRDPGQIAVSEMTYFVGGLIIAFISATGGMLFVGVRLGGLASVADHSTSVSGILAAVGDSAYYTVRMFSTAGDASPTTGPAKLLSATIFAVSGGYLLGVLGLLGGLISSVNRLPSARQPTASDTIAITHAASTRPARVVDGTPTEPQVG
jgi:hypothetical protein